LLFDALSDGLADGFRSHLPDLVGILLEGIVGLLLAAAAHVLLGVPGVPLGFVASAYGAGTAVARRRKRSPR
jgi:hypothetical protein